MSQYIKHLEEMSDSQTSKRKLEYLDYNIGNFIAKLTKKSTILEIGPGTGEFEQLLNKRDFADIDIVDNDRSILNFVSSKRRIKNKFLTSDLLKIKSKLRNYDLILMVQVLEHIPISKFTPFIKTLFSKLNKEGNLIIVVPNGNNPLGLTERYADLQHTISFTTQSLKDLINITNLNNYQIQIRGYEIPPYTPVNIIRKILQKILHSILLLVMIINGGLFYKIMTPNIMLIIKKK